MKELLAFGKPIAVFPCASRAVKHVKRPDNVCLCKDLGVSYAPVNMRFRGKMNDIVYVVFRKNFRNSIPIAYIGFDEGIVNVSFKIRKIFQISRVCQKIHIDDLYVIFVGFEYVMYEV